MIVGIKLLKPHYPYFLLQPKKLQHQLELQHMMPILLPNLRIVLLHLLIQQLIKLMKQLVMHNLQHSKLNRLQIKQILLLKRQMKLQHKYYLVNLKELKQRTLDKQQKQKDNLLKKKENLQRKQGSQQNNPEKKLKHLEYLQKNLELQQNLKE